MRRASLLPERTSEGQSSETANCEPAVYRYTFYHSACTRLVCTHERVVTRVYTDTGATDVTHTCTRRATAARTHARKVVRAAAAPRKGALAFPLASQPNLPLPRLGSLQPAAAAAAAADPPSPPFPSAGADPHHRP